MTFWQRGNSPLQAMASRATADLPHSTTVASAAARSSSVRRLLTRLAWLDTILGGGFTRGSVVMLHGDPGSGKSTLLAQAVSGVRGGVYVSAEEDLGQVAQRFIRLGLRTDVELCGERDIRDALTVAGRAPLIIIDSVSTVRPGPVEATEIAVDHARQSGACIVLVCHEVKAGMHAGPRVIEHMIDCTIKINRARVLSVEKNRYGPAGDVGVELVMTERGLMARGR